MDWFSGSTFNSPQTYQVIDSATGRVTNFTNPNEAEYYKGELYYRQRQVCTNSDYNYPQAVCMSEPESKEDKLRKERKSKLKGLIAHYYNRK